MKYDAVLNLYSVSVDHVLKISEYFLNILTMKCGPVSRHDNPQQSSPSTTTT
jgi:hypothetical protein